MGSSAGPLIWQNSKIEKLRSQGPWSVTGFQLTYHLVNRHEIETYLNRGGENFFVGYWVKLESEGRVSQCNNKGFGYEFANICVAMLMGDKLANGRLELSANSINLYLSFINKI